MWIEIWRALSYPPLSSVTPYAGVWIEILALLCFSISAIGHSLRGSVDWNRITRNFIQAINVTPYAGVWIEIRSTLIKARLLKMSLPTRECGLKYTECKCCNELWTGHSLRGSVDWNVIVAVILNVGLRSLPTRECGLKYRKRTTRVIRNSGHSLRGSVDWNYCIR